VADVGCLFEKRLGLGDVGAPVLGPVLEAGYVGVELGVAGDGVLPPPAGHERGHGADVVRVGDSPLPVLVEVGKELGSVLGDRLAQRLRVPLGMGGTTGVGTAAWTVMTIRSFDAPCV
jgi:hypothetical protein